MLDLIIIGGAAVGSSAAIYAARRRLEFKMITLDLGGEVALSGEVANWPGIISTQGFELAQQFTKHVKSYNVDIEEGWKVVSITSQKNYHIVTAENAKSEQKTYETKTVIIGSGIHPRHLNVPGEEQFLHKGLTYCTVCDGPLFKNKVTATIGSGNSALESALMMQGIAQKVYVLSKFPNTKETNFGFPPGENILIEKFNGGPTGLNTLSAAIAEEIDTIETVYEPYLLQTGFIERTPRGRKATRSAYTHLGFSPPQEQTLF
jgi:alkyl hydroperoxide reductase subunit AhpF